LATVQARHRKPSYQPTTQGRPSGPAVFISGRPRHRKPSALQGKPAKATAVTALAVSAAAASATVAQWPAGPSGHPAVASKANLRATDRQPSAGAGPSTAALAAQPTPMYHPAINLNVLPHPRPQGKHHRRPAVSVAVAAPASSSPPGAPYSNPLRAVTALVPERVDMGVDFAGSGPVYALGNAVITGATGSSSGWPGGGWITYRLTDGPDAGLMVYVAEDVQPVAAVGEVVTPATVIADMYDGGTGIETGWAMPDGASAESQLSEAGGIGGGGPFPTMVGLSFEDLLRGLGVPASPNAGDTGYGTLPPGYPAG
jgi:hypothetical protein